MKLTFKQWKQIETMLQCDYIAKQDDYQNNIRNLRHMLQAISFDNWADSWRVSPI